MERIEVVARAAAKLRAQDQRSGVEVHAAQLIEHLCDVLDLELRAVPVGGVMLGGAYSRLQLWAWDQPELGGIIWLRDDLDVQSRIFAIAHELGHYALHRGEGISLRPACDQNEVDQRADPSDLRTEDHRVEEYTPRARRESEANAFAAELLAPCALVRRLFATEQSIDAPRLAAHLGISLSLAQRRLIDAVLGSTRPTSDASEPQSPDDGNVPVGPMLSELIDQLDPSQQDAARTSGPALIVAGPGTGKTATLIGRTAHLIGERGIPPERVLALTFSNRAAGEMRERLARSGLPGERMPVMTLHAFAVSLLREYAPRVPHAPDEAELTPDFRILDEADSFLLMEELLAKLPLHYYRSLGNPTAHVRALLTDFSRARDALLTPADYLALVEAMPLSPAQQDESDTEGSDTTATRKRAKGGKHRPPAGTFTAEQIAKARERATAYGVWDHELRRRGLVDFGGLIQRAVELLHTDAQALAHVRGRYREILVDEFQDTNHAAAELLMLVAGASGSGLWVVGDRNQSIYRFRGASPHNLPRLVEQYPTLRVLTLRRCYRSVPAIVRLGSTMAARMTELAAHAAADNTAARAVGAASESSSALSQALRPLELEPVRADAMHPAIRCGEKFVSAAHERVGLAATIEQHRALGFTYGDQAVLCRTHKQVRQIASILASQGVPVSQVGDFFDRSEVKDALMLVALAAGPDARGVLRAAPLLFGLSDPPPTDQELSVAARELASARHALPGALRRGAVLDRVAALSATARAGLAALGDAAMELRNSPVVGERLAAFLLRPRGYAWRLARIADGRDGCDASRPADADRRADSQTHPSLVNATPAQAQQALAALGELVRLAWRFDVRWSREPDFRARLSRAVTHRRIAPPGPPDALEPVPGADATPTLTLQSQPQFADTAPAVRCFIHYLGALRACDTVIPVPAGDDNVVQVLTLHQSKGLEFPVVNLPGLASGQFPAAATAAREEVCPPGFRESDAPNEHDAEERCLFYVGVTRARDVVTFTRAASYGKATSGKRRSTQPSMLLELLDRAPDWLDAEPLLPDDEIERLLAVAAAYEDMDAEDDEEAGEVVSQAGQTLESRAASSLVFRLRDLQQYLACPQQYKYARSYGLLDPAEDAVQRFHRYIRRGAQTLRELQATVPMTDWSAAEARLRVLWETDGPAGHAYDAFYWQAAETILREEWSTITAPQGAAASGRVLLAQPLRATLRRCTIELTADRVIDNIPAAGDPVAPPQTLLVRLHTGRPRDDDANDLTLPLYYLAHKQQHPDVPVQIAMAYVGGALADQSTAANEPGQAALVNVTETARRTAETYLQPERKRRSTLDKLDEAALGIAAGRFAPRPEERRCAACAYCYVCPVDPESVPLSTTPMSSENRIPLETTV